MNNIYFSNVKENNGVLDSIVLTPSDKRRMICNDNNNFKVHNFNYYGKLDTY
jgi:hypothetical protein